MLLSLAAPTLVVGHDIPNARVDRSIQATLSPGRLRVDYEVSLSELTLTQDLRRLIGELPGAERKGWFEEYGRVLGPLDAKGLLVAVDGEPIDLNSIGFVLEIESHPRYTFHFEAEVPAKGRLTLNDTNYVASEGTSRLALKSSGGVSVRGDSLPSDVASIPIVPVWQLSDAEERRTRSLKVEYRPRLHSGAGPDLGGPGHQIGSHAAIQRIIATPRRPGRSGLARLDSGRGRPRRGARDPAGARQDDRGRVVARRRRRAVPGGLARPGDRDGPSRQRRA